MDAWPLAAACWLTKAMKPAHNGEAQLVPPNMPSLTAAGNHKYIVSRKRDVRNIALSGGTAIGGHADVRLPTGIPIWCCCRRWCPHSHPDSKSSRRC